MVYYSLTGLYVNIYRLLNNEPKVTKSNSRYKVALVLSNLMYIVAHNFFEILCTFQARLHCVSLMLLFSLKLALYVLSFLEPRDLLRAAQTCRYWRLLCEDNLLWREKCRTAGIEEVPSGHHRKRHRTPALSTPPINLSTNKAEIITGPSFSPSSQTSNTSPALQQPLPSPWKVRKNSSSW
jgi:hypothetical protein